MQIGHLDSIIDGEISGWALDSDFPDQVIDVAVYLDGQLTAKALAVYHRPDVAEHFKSSGRHGFYVDLTTELAVREATLDVKLPSGDSLYGAPIQVSVPDRSPKRQPTLLFMHIPKTAGTSFREAIARNYKTSEIAFLYPDEPGFRIRSFEDLPLDQRSRTRLIAGHEVYYGVHEHVPNESLYFTVVRDPISRVWSNYIHLLQTTDTRIFDGAKPASLEKIFESKSRGDIDNVMVRFFLVSPKANLQQAYAWLRHKLDWRIESPVPLMNVTDYTFTQQCGEFDRKVIRHFNEWDCRLYEDLLSSG